MVTTRRSFNISDILEPEKDLKIDGNDRLSTLEKDTISPFSANVSIGYSTPGLWTAGSLPRYADSIAPGLGSRLSSFLPTQTFTSSQSTAALGTLYTLGMGLSPYTQLQSQFGKYIDRYQELLTPYTTKNGTSQRRVRTIFTKLQLMALESLFQQQHYLSPHKRRETAFLLNLNETQVQTWFQNRRAKCKRKVETIETMPSPEQNKKRMSPVSSDHGDISQKNCLNSPNCDR